MYFYIRVIINLYIFNLYINKYDIFNHLFTYFLLSLFQYVLSEVTLFFETL